MFSRVRLGIRLQLTLIVLLGAVLSTAATLFIANNAIATYALQQAQTQEQNNMKIARLVLTTQYGQNVSISSDNQIVADSPSAAKDFTSTDVNFGRYPLNNDTEFVDAVQQLIGGTVVVYQCANARGTFTGCVPVATTLTTKSAKSGVVERNLTLPFNSTMGNKTHMDLSGSPREWLGEDTVAGNQYYADYYPLYNPQQQLIGVLFVGVPLDVVTGFQTRTTVELLLLGAIIMIAGVIFALLFASAIVNTLQRAARQVSNASERIGGIAAQQAGGAAQQVWAVNAMNKALAGFADMARDIAQRTDQLALMGNQVVQRRSEIAPAQIDSILAYMTRSVRDISVASRQQASQYERMGGAMQAVIEIAEQVAGNSQQTSESSERLDLVVRQLQQLVGVSRMRMRASTQDSAEENPREMDMRAGLIAPSSQSAYGMRGGRGDYAPNGYGMASNGSMNGGMGMGMAGAGSSNNNMGRMRMPQQGMEPAGVGQMGYGQMGQMSGGRNGGRAPNSRDPQRMNGGRYNDEGFSVPPLPPMPPLPAMPDGPQQGRMAYGDQQYPPSNSNRSNYDGQRSGFGWRGDGPFSNPNPYGNE